MLEDLVKIGGLGDVASKKIKYLLKVDITFVER